MGRSRAPSSVNIQCHEIIEPLLAPDQLEIVTQSWWQRLLGRTERETFLLSRYRESFREMSELSLEQLNAENFYFGDSIEFEDLAAYMDVLILKSRGEGAQGLLNSLRNADSKAQKNLLKLRRRIERDQHLTPSEIRSFVGQYYLSQIGAPPSVFKDRAAAFEHLAYQAFLNQLTQKSISELFAAQSYKNPRLYQRAIDLVIRASKSRIVTITRNIVMPILQVKSGVIPLPLKPVDFVLDEEIVELIMRKGLTEAWPTIERRYQKLGITSLGFNELARYYRPVGALGFFVTAFFMIDRHNQKQLELQAAQAHEQIMNELDEYQESAREIVESLDNPMMEQALAEFQDIYGRAPTEEEKQELLLLFGE